MRNANDIHKPFTAYISDKERLAAIEKALAETADVKTLCDCTLKDFYERELALFSNRDAIVVSSCFLRSIIPLLTSYMGGRTVASIREGIYRYVLHKGRKGTNKEKEQKDLTAYITDKKRLAAIEKAVADVDNYKELCLGVIADIYNKELTRFEDRDIIVASSAFLKPIIAMLKNYNGNPKVSSLSNSVKRYVLRKEEFCKRKKGKDIVTLVTDKKRLKGIEKKLAEVDNYKDLCLGVIGDIYNNELADKVNRDEIVGSVAFIRSIIPYVKNFKEPRICNERNIRKSIDHYLFGKKRNKGKKKSYAYKKKHVTTGQKRKTPVTYPLMEYITDDKRKNEIASALANVKDKKMLCRDVIWDVYTKELAEREDKNIIIVSKRFIESLFPYMKNFQGKLTVSNIYPAIRKYVILREESKSRMLI